MKIVPFSVPTTRRLTLSGSSESFLSTWGRVKRRGRVEGRSRLHAGDEGLLLEGEGLHLGDVLCSLALALHTVSEEGEGRGATSMRRRSREWAERLQPESLAEESMPRASLGVILAVL
jgi:hypothetical protein